jgi:hypothetical protein
MAVLSLSITGESRFNSHSLTASAANTSGFLYGPIKTAPGTESAHNLGSYRDLIGESQMTPSGERIKHMYFNEARPKWTHFSNPTEGKMAHLASVFDRPEWRIEFSFPRGRASNRSTVPDLGLPSKAHPLP